MEKAITTESHCSICNSGPFCPKYLRKHIQRVHRRAEQSECEFCGATFTRRSDVTRHYRTCKVRKQELASSDVSRGPSTHRSRSRSPLASYSRKLQSSSTAEPHPEGDPSTGLALSSEVVHLPPVKSILRGSDSRKRTLSCDDQLQLPPKKRRVQWEQDTSLIATNGTRKRKISPSTDDSVLSKASRKRNLSSVELPPAKIGRRDASSNLPPVPPLQLPDWLKNRRGIYSLDSNAKTGVPYNDHLSLLRCLALHQGASKRKLEHASKLLLDKWCGFSSQTLWEFAGIEGDEFDDFEKCFNTPVYLYALVPSVQPTTEQSAAEMADDAGDLTEQLTKQAEAEAVAISEGKFAAVIQRRPNLKKSESSNDAMNLNVFQHQGKSHYSYIHDFATYSLSYQCSKCLKLLPCRRDMERHEKTCNGAETVDKFPGNGYVIKPMIFEKLQRAGILVPEYFRYHPHFAAYDFESLSTVTAIECFEKLPAMTSENVIPQDPASPPECASAFVKHNWKQIQSRVSSKRDFAVIRNPEMSRIGEYVKAISQQQHSKFAIHLQALTANSKGNLSRVALWESGIICNVSCFYGQLATLSNESIVSKLRNRRAFALRINIKSKKQEIVGELEPVSVAIASNVDGFTDPNFFLSKGNSGELVNDFVNYLEEVSAKSKQILTRRYQHVINRLRTLINVLPRHANDILADYGIPPVTRGLKKHHYEEMKKQKPKVYNSDVKEYHELIRRRKLYDHLLKELQAWISTLPVLSFNGSRFDINLVAGELLWNLQNRQDAKIKLITKGTSYMSITTKTLKFLDICHYLSPGFSYDSWLKAYEIPVGKAVFPHEWLVSLDCLQATSLPPKDAFFSTLKNQGITDEEYAKAQEAWVTHGMQTMADYISYYNKLDVGPFIIAAEKMRQIWISEGLCIFGSGSISLPGLAIRSLMASLPPHTSLVLPQKPAAEANDSSNMYYRMRENITGGPSIIFCRYAKAHETRIRDPMRGMLCDGIIGWDCNSMYLEATCRREMPTGIPIHYSMGDDGFFIRKQTYPNAQAELEWLEWQSYCLGFKIEHRFNTGKVVSVHGQHPDGYAHGPIIKLDDNGRRVDGAAKHIFYFDGCWTHGHECHLTKNRTWKSDHQQKRLMDKFNRDDLRRLGYEVHEITQCTWEEMKKQNITPKQNNGTLLVDPPDANTMRLNEFRQKHFSLPSHGKMTTAKMINEIKAGRFFGMVVCDIRVPETPKMRAKFAEMTPIFKNTEINFKDIGPYMQQRCVENELQNIFPLRSLIGSYFAKEIMLATPLIKFYLEEGLEITRIYEAWESKPKILFEDFANKIADCRRAADKDPRLAIIAQSEKLKGNACYGKLVTKKERHRDTIICIDGDLASHARDPYFDIARQLNEKCSEIKKRKKYIVQDNYTAIGFFTYQYAKLILLEFYYRFLDRFWPRETFEMLETDTDSVYVAVADMDFEKLVKPELKEEFKRLRNRFLPDNSTPERLAYFNREPGLFKVEATGDGFVGLCAKTHILTDSISGKTKMACKGLPKNLNRLTIDDFRQVQVLEREKSTGGFVRGFRRGPNGGLIRQDGYRLGLTHHYYKRQVTDGIHTIPLEI